MDRAGIRRELGMAVSGHKRDDVYRRYNIVAESELGEVAGKMATFREQQKAKLRRIK